MGSLAIPDPAPESREKGRPLVGRPPGSEKLGWCRVEAAVEAARSRQGPKPWRRPESAIGEADGAPTPPGGLPPSPARAGRVASVVSTGDRLVRGCARGLFRLQKSMGDTRSAPASGSLAEIAARFTRGPVTRVSHGAEGRKRCPKPARAKRRYGGRLSVISRFVFGVCASRGRRRGAEERAPVEGRRPGFAGAAVFDEMAAEAGPSGGQRGSSRKAGSSGVVVAKGVRGRAACSGVADKAACGSHGAGELSIEALVPVPRGVRERRRTGFGPRCASRVVARPKLEFAVKRSSTGSRGLRVTGPQGHGARGARDRESGSTVGARVVSRLQKSERRIFCVGAVRRGVTRDELGSKQ